jgi:hypothetical protein
LPRDRSRGAERDRSTEERSDYQQFQNSFSKISQKKITNPPVSSKEDSAQNLNQFKNSKLFQKFMAKEQSKKPEPVSEIAKTYKVNQKLATMKSPRKEEDIPPPKRVVRDDTPVIIQNENVQSFAAASNREIHAEVKQGP